MRATSRSSLHYSFDTSIGRHFVSFMTHISCFYIYLVKYFDFEWEIYFIKEFFWSDRIVIIFQHSDRIQIR
jgi:hypothetical protein